MAGIHFFLQNFFFLEQKMESNGGERKGRMKARTVRLLRKREPQLVEGAKRSLILRGHHTSETIVQVLRDLSQLTKPHSVMLSRKNEILPFEDVNSIEFLTTKNDCALFALGSHTKKRPDNLVLVRKTKINKIN